MWPQAFVAFRKDGMDVAQHLMSDNATVAALKAEKFDLILRDATYWPTKLLSQMLHVPAVEVLSGGVMQPVYEAWYSAPNPIAYYPQCFSELSPIMVSFGIPCALAKTLVP